MIVAALIEVHDDVELGHGRRLLGRGRYDPDIALAGVEEQVWPAVVEAFRAQTNLRSRVDINPPRTAPASTSPPIVRSNTVYSKSAY